MRLSCWIDSAPGETLSDRAHFLADCGFAAMEWYASLPELSDRLTELRALVRAGIGISAIGPIHRGWLIDPDPALRQAAGEDIARTLAWASELGTAVIVLPILGYTRALPNGRTTGRTAEADRQMLIDNLGPLAERARELGTALVIEVINRYESPVMNTLAEGVRVMAAVNSAHCKLAVDLFHMNIEESDPAAALSRAGSFLGLVHLADSNRSFPGLGHTDFAGPLWVLGQLSYGGYLTVEAIDHHRDVRQILPRTVQLLKGLIGG